MDENWDLVDCVMLVGNGWVNEYKNKWYKVISHDINRIDIMSHDGEIPISKFSLDRNGYKTKPKNNLVYKMMNI